MSAIEERSEVSSAGPCRKLNDYSSRDVAEELCLIDSELLRKIDPNELQNGAWMKKEKKYTLAPNIMAMVNAFNQLALLIPSEILDERTPQARAKVISTFIKIAHKCYSFGNYNSLKAVLAGLQCTPIFRLKKTWKEVPSKRRKRFQYLCDRMSEDKNWRLYRDEIDRRLTTQSAIIPFLGVFLTTVALSQEANNMTEVTSPRVTTDSGRRRRDSLYENYVILEAVTVRKRLEKLRTSRSTDAPIEECLSPASVIRESDSEFNDLDSTISPTHRPFPDIGATDPRNGGIAYTDHDVSTRILSEEIDRHQPHGLLLEAAEECRGSNDDGFASTRIESDYTPVTSHETDDHTHLNHNPRRNSSIDQPANVRNHVDTKGSSVEKSYDPNEKQDSKPVDHVTSKGSSRKKRITLRSLRLRKKKAKATEEEEEEEKKQQATPSHDQLSRKGSVLSGSLECLIDAVSQEDNQPSVSSEITRSISLFNLSTEVDNGEEEEEQEDAGNYLSDTSPSLASEMSLQSEPHTSNESLQRIRSDDGCGTVIRQVKHRSLPDQQDHSHILDLQQPMADSNKLEHRHSWKMVNEGVPRPRMTRHMRNKSDTSMLPTFQHAYMYTNTASSSSSPKHPGGSQNILQSLHDHIKSMPNVFRRDRASKPIVSELRASQLSKPSDPISLLIQYQFLSLRCCAGVQGHPDIRTLVQEAHHNTEVQNYKLSFEREPNN